MLLPVGLCCKIHSDVVILSLTYLFQTVACIRSDIYRDYETKLFNDILDLTDYDTRVRPKLSRARPNVNGPEIITTDVTLTYTPRALLELNEKSQTLHITATLSLQWVDHRLTWVPEDYDDIRQIYAPLYQLWYPRVMFLNSVKQTQMSGLDGPLTTVRHTGHVTWVVDDVIGIYCDIQVSYYPFDVQNCTTEISFDPLTYAELNATPLYDLTRFNTGGTWQLTGSHCRSLTPRKNSIHQHQLLTFTLRLSRHKSYYIMNILLPVIFHSLMAPLVFVLPVECGEKMGVSITLLLSYSVYLSAIADELPHTSEQVCYLQVYITLMLGAISLGILMTALVIKLHHRPPDIEVGSTFLTVVRFSETCASLTAHDNDGNGFRITNMIYPNTVYGSIVKDHRSYLEDDVTRGQGHQVKSGHDAITWPSVAAGLDRVLFLTFILVIVSSTAVLLPCMVFQGSSEELGDILGTAGCLDGSSGDYLHPYTTDR